MEPQPLLEQEMLEAAEALEFERAALLRDQWRELKTAAGLGKSKEQKGKSKETGGKSIEQSAKRKETGAQQKTGKFRYPLSGKSYQAGKKEKR